MEDLDHHAVYTWHISGLTSGANPLIGSNQTVTSAVLHFENIRNWQDADNRLFMHLLDTAQTTATVAASGIGNGLMINGVFTQSPVSTTLYRAIDDTNPSNTNLTIRDDLGRDTNGLPTAYYGVGNQLVSSATANTPIGNNFATTSYGGGFILSEGWATGALGTPTRSFSTTPEDYEFTFTTPFLQSLNGYIQNGGDFAIGLDPDCHYFNDGVWLTLTTSTTGVTAVPEPASLTLLGTGLAGLYARRRRARASQ